MKVIEKETDRPTQHIRPLPSESSVSPEKRYHRRSIRLNGYDYSQPGVYFITICVQKYQCLLTAEPVREMVHNTWQELSNRFGHVALDEFVAMPNHIHGIIVLNVGAGHRACPDIGQPRRVAPTYGAPLADVVHWSKSMTTTRYRYGVQNQGWVRFSGRLWQRNYYEHIIRNEDQLNSIREYIHLNPLKWELDRENPNRKLDQAYENQWKWLEGVRRQCEKKS